MRSLTLFVVVPMLVVLGGCAAEEVVELGEISGKVTLNGAPLTDAIVTFDQPAAGLGGTAKVDGQGQYVFTDKLPVGSYRVIVARAPITPPNPGEAAPVIPPSKVPPKYSNPETSGLSAEVGPGKNDLNFDLK